jgi:hypothetical protein
MFAVIVVTAVVGGVFVRMAVCFGIESKRKEVIIVTHDLVRVAIPTA